MLCKRCIQYVYPGHRSTKWIIQGKILYTHCEMRMCSSSRVPFPREGYNNRTSSNESTTEGLLSSISCWCVELKKCSICGFFCLFALEYNLLPAARNVHSYLSNVPVMNLETSRLSCCFMTSPGESMSDVNSNGTRQLHCNLVIAFSWPQKTAVFSTTTRVMRSRGASQS